MTLLHYSPFWLALAWALSLLFAVLLTIWMTLRAAPTVRHHHYYPKRGAFVDEPKRVKPESSRCTECERRAKRALEGRTTDWRKWSHPVEGIVYDYPPSDRWHQQDFGWVFRSGVVYRHYYDDGREEVCKSQAGSVSFARSGKIVPLKPQPPTASSPAPPEVRGGVWYRNPNNLGEPTLWRDGGDCIWAKPYAHIDAHRSIVYDGDGFREKFQRAIASGHLIPA